MRDRKSFRPLVYADWLPLFKTMSEHERSEVLLAIASFPDYEPENVALWPFFREQLEKQLDAYREKCDKNQRIAHEREQNRAQRSERTRTYTNVNERTQTSTQEHGRTPNLLPITYNLVPKKESKKEKASAMTHRFALTSIPPEWKEYASKVRPDLDAEKEFTSFAFYFTSGKGSSKLRSDKGWSQAWQGWVRRAKEHAQHSQTTNMFTVVKPRQPANRDDDVDPDFDMGSFGVAK